MTKVFFYFIFLASYCSLAHASSDTLGSSLAIAHAETGKILYAKNIDSRIYPASMTKIATALFILRKHPEVLDRLITVHHEAIATITPHAKKQSGYRSPSHWLETDGVTIQLQNKEEICGRDLFHALLICSANDAANTLAIACSGSVPKFMHQMHLFLQELGCQHTHFNNPHGLHHPDHYTTARDLILIMREGLKEPLFRQVMHTTHYKIAPTNLSQERLISTTNKLLLSSSPHYYPPVLGGKTGSTQSAGKNLIFAAQKNERFLVTIATGYSTMNQLYRDVKSLCEEMFNEPLLRRYLISPTESYSLTLGKLGVIRTALTQGVYYDFYASEGEEPLTLAFVPHATSFPIRRGELLGHWVLRNTSGKQVKTLPLHATQTIEPTLLQHIHIYGKKILASYRTYVVLFLLLLYCRKRHSPKRKTSRYY